MKNSIVFSIFILFGLYLFRIYAHDQSPVSFAKGVDDFKVSGVPDFNLAEYNAVYTNFSKKSDLAPFHDKVMLINFWATWCAPCMEEFPALVKLAKLHEKNGDLQVFAISVDKELSPVQKFVTKMKDIPANFHILLDPEGAVAHKYGTIKIPETYIIDSHHKLLRKALGDQSWLSSDFAKLIKNFSEKRNL